MNLIIHAAWFANRWHNGQLRKWTGRPYIEHPMRVAGRVTLLEDYDDVTPEVVESVVAAAWLHDVIEDCAVTRTAFIYGAGLPPEIYDIVCELTKQNKAEQPGMNRADRCAAYLERLRTASWSAKVIKLADRIDNLSEISGAPVDFLSVYVKETEQLLEVLQGTHEPFEQELKELTRKLVLT